jgi:hypothetical protein
MAPRKKPAPEKLHSGRLVKQHFIAIGKFAETMTYRKSLCSQISFRQAMQLFSKTDECWHLLAGESSDRTIRRRAAAQKGN